MPQYGVASGLYIDCLVPTSYWVASSFAPLPGYGLIILIVNLLYLNTIPCVVPPLCAVKVHSRALTVYMDENATFGFAGTIGSRDIGRVEALIPKRVEVM